MNKIIIKGRLTADPEVKRTQSDVPFAKFTVAVDRAYNKGEEKQADFFPCTAWRQSAEFIGKYFRRGQEILVLGEMNSKKYQDKEGQNRVAWELNVERVEFCGPKSVGSDGEAYAATNGAPAYAAGGAAPNFVAVSEDEDLPF